MGITNFHPFLSCLHYLLDQEIKDRVILCDITPIRDQKYLVSMLENGQIPLKNLYQALREEPYRINATSNTTAKLMQVGIISETGRHKYCKSHKIVSPNPEIFEVEGLKEFLDKIFLPISNLEKFFQE